MFLAKSQGLNPVLYESRKKSADARNRHGDGRLVPILGTGLLKRIVCTLECCRIPPLMVKKVVETGDNNSPTFLYSMASIFCCRIIFLNLILPVADNAGDLFQVVL